MSNHYPIYDSTFLIQVGPKQRSNRKIYNDKRAIQSEKSMKRNVLIEITVDDPNGLSRQIGCEKAMIN